MARHIILQHEGARYFACMLRGIAASDTVSAPGDGITELGGPGQPSLITALRAFGPSFRFELRWMIRPGSVSRVGRTVLALLARVDGVSGAGAPSSAQELVHLLASTLPHFDFSPATDRDLRCLVTRPRPPHLLAIEPRSLAPDLPGLIGSRAPVGFATGTPEPRPAGGLLYEVPFAPSTASATPLLRLLHSRARPVELAIHLHPVLLTDEELDRMGALAEAWSRLSDEYARYGAGLVGEEAASFRARAFANRLAQRRDDLCRSGAVRLSITLGSHSPLSSVVAAQVASWVVGNSQDESKAAPVGGFELREISGSCVSRGQSNGVLLSVSEAAEVFRFPIPAATPLPGIPVRRWRRIEVATPLPTDGVRVGTARSMGKHRAVRLTGEDHLRHMYVLGQTGTGKTTLLRTMIQDDMEAGRGVCVVDPHGDLFQDLLGRVPPSRLDDVVVLDPTDRERPVGLNPLECEDEEQRHYVAQEFTGILTRIVRNENGQEAAGLVGPIFLQHLRRNLLLVTSDCEAPGTLVQLYTLFNTDGFWRRWLPLRLEDPLLKQWVEETLPKTSYGRAGSEGISLGGYVGSKLEDFVFDPALRCIFGQARSTVRVSEIMDEGKILLVNLSGAALARPSARFLGMLLLAQIHAATMARAGRPPTARRPFHLYVDEFHAFATHSQGPLLSEARKYGVGLVLADQYLGQMREAGLASAVLGNVGTLALFRLGPEDAEALERHVLPAAGRHDLMNLPNHEAYLRLSSHGTPLPPLSITTHPAGRDHDPRIAEEVRRHSRERYGRARGDVEREIEASLAPLVVRTRSLPR